jgi:DNA modification methylase
MPESVTDRPTKSHEYLFLLAKSERYYYDRESIAEDSVRAGDIPGGRGGHIEHIHGHNKDGLGECSKRSVAEKRNRRSVWTIPTEPTPEAHFATFPRKLVAPCILAGCPPGGIVLDPFGGSGTTGRVARDNGRSWLLFDLSARYAEIAKRKIDGT